MSAATNVPGLIYASTDGERTFLLNRDSTFIGRSASNEIVLPDAFVSRQHVRIVREDLAFFVIDLGSTRGTFLNGQRISERTPLHAGDILQLGSLHAPRLYFQSGTADRSGDEEIEPAQDFLATMTGFLSSAKGQRSQHVSREIEQLNFLLGAARALSSGEAMEDILRALLQLTLQLTQVERGFVFLREDGAMRLAQGRRSDGSELFEDSSISRSAINSAIESDSKFTISDTLANEDASSQSSILANHIRSIYCIPLRKRGSSQRQGELLGLLYLDSQISASELGSIDHQLLDAIAAEAAGLLHNVLLAQEEHKARKDREELAIAARIHAGLMSIKFPTLPFAVLKARTLPCHAIGGDFFDAVAVDDHVTVVLADVSGKGVSAAIVAATLQGIIHAQLMARMGLPEIANLVNQFLCERGVNKYATMVMIRLFQDGRADYLNCGHIQPVAVRGDQVKRLQEGNLIVGLIPSATYFCAEYQLQPGERILIATDGVTEAETPEGECFGEDGLDSMACLPSLDEMFNCVSSFHAPNEAQDDCTLVEVSYTGLQLPLIRD